METYPGLDRKEKYLAFCEAQNNIPVFIQPWWLDLDAGPENWDVVLAQNNSQIVGAFPFCKTNLKIFKGIGMPLVAPYQGYHIHYPSDQNKTASRLAWEEKILNVLFGNLPAHSFFYLHLFPETQSTLPILWLGFRSSMKYSFILQDLSDLEMIFSGFEKRARTVIKKAATILSVSESASADNLIALTKLTYQKQNLQPPYDFARLKLLTETVLRKGKGKIYEAKDSTGRVHSASFVVWDRGTAFYTIQATNPELMAGGSASFMVWHAIQEASKEEMARFDFTGSSMPNIAKYLRSFGAKPIQRNYISKENTFLFYWLMRLKEYAGK